MMNCSLTDWVLRGRRFMVAVIAALGYGFGETIARLSGWPVFMCVAACFAVGMLSEEIISLPF